MSISKELFIGLLALVLSIVLSIGLSSRVGFHLDVSSMPEEAQQIVKSIPSGGSLTSEQLAEINRIRSISDPLVARKGLVLTFVAYWFVFILIPTFFYFIGTTKSAPVIFRVALRYGPSLVFLLLMLYLYYIKYSS